MRKLGILLVLFALTRVSLEGKPKTVVQLVGDYSDIPMAGMYVVTAYLILPDGTHAYGECVESTIDHKPCKVEPFVAEKRKIVPCTEMKNKTAATCYYSERYYADRKGNDIALHAQNGKITYHIQGTW